MSGDDETIDGFSTDSRNPLEILADEFSSAIRSGEQPSVEEYAARVPEQRDEAIALLRSIAMFERVSEEDLARKRIDRKTRQLAQRRLETLGDFRIIREIGRGGMGIIYEAEQVSLKRRVALKVLGPGIADTPRQLERFRRESEAVARLHHTNIVPVFGVGEDDGVHYYAMQLIRGKPLSESREYSLPEIAKLGMQAAGALAYAHSHGVLHRDIKPSNLLLDEEGNLWVTDFGLAKLTDVGELTQTGDIMGTLKYMAPEQLDGRADERTDVYALGLTLYELTTGKPAFDVSKSLINRIRNHQFPSPRSVNKQIPIDLETIILKATAHDAISRYASAAAMADDLRRFSEDRPIEARRASQLEKLTRWSRRNPALAVSTAATVLLLLTTTGVSAWGYLTTSSALATAHDALDEADSARKGAERAQARAESNLLTAMNAFDAIFDNVAARGVPQVLALDIAEDDDTQTPPFESTLTEDDVLLLDKLLRFYNEFAVQNESDTALKSKTALAYKRSGTILERLGRSEKAEEAYIKALKLLRELADNNPESADTILAISQTLNDRGLSRAVNTSNFMEAVEIHHEAIDMLRRCSERIRSLPEIRFEMARGLDCAGSLMARSGGDLIADGTAGGRPGKMSGPGRGPGGPAGQSEPPFEFGGPGMPHPEFDFGPNGPPPDFQRRDDQQIGPGPEIRDPNNRPAERQGDRQGMGRGRFGEDPMRPRGRPAGGPGENIANELNEAAELLGGLCREYPDNDDYRFALAQVHHHRMSHWLIESRIHEAEQAFEASLRELDALIEKNPNQPRALVERSDTLAAAGLGLKSLSPDQRRSYLEQAVANAEKLCEAFPNNAEYQTLLGGTHYKLGVSAAQNRPEQSPELEVAENHLDKAVEAFDNLHRRFPSNRFYRFRFLVAYHQFILLQLRPEWNDKLNDEQIQKMRDRLAGVLDEFASETNVERGAGGIAGRAHQTLAQLEHRLGNTEAAEAALKKAKKFGPQMQPPQGVPRFGGERDRL
ncbi:MAG: protein kinase [Pirellulales bacterium]